jgi:hypothetical protein
MKRPRLSAERLVGLGMVRKQRRNRRRHLITGGGHHRGSRERAPTLASLSDEPMPATSPAAAANISGAAITYDTAGLPLGHFSTIGDMKRPTGIVIPT